MAGTDFFGSAPISLQDMFSTAQQVGADLSFNTERTSDTVVSNAVDAGVPVDNQAGGAWGDFWRGALGSIVSYGIAKDAQRNAIAAPGQPAPVVTHAPAAAPAMPGWMLPAAVAGAALLAVVVLRRG